MCVRAQVFGAVSIVPVLVGSLSPERERHYGAIFARPALVMSDAPEISPPKMHIFGGDIRGRPPTEIPCRRYGTGDGSDLGRARSHARLEWILASLVSKRSESSGNGSESFRKG